MKHYIVACLLFLTVSLFASEYNARVLITKVTQKSYISDVQRRVSSLGYRVYMQKRDGGYYLYSQPLYSKGEAYTALTKLQRVFPYAKIVVQKGHEKNFFLQASLADTLLSTSDGIKNSFGFELTAGYSGQSYRAELSYMATSSDYRDYSNVTLSLLYPFLKLQSFEMQGGGVIGYGSLKLNNYTYSSPASSLIYGGELVQVYRITSHFACTLTYKVLKSDFTIKREAEDDFTTTLTHSFMGGVRYSF